MSKSSKGQTVSMVPLKDIKKDRSLIKEMGLTNYINRIRDDTNAWLTKPGHSQINIVNRTSLSKSTLSRFLKNSRNKKLSKDTVRDLVRELSAFLDGHDVWQLFKTAWRNPTQLCQVATPLPKRFRGQTKYL